MKRTVKGVWMALAMLLLAGGFLLASGQAEPEDDVVRLRVWFGREEFVPGDNFATFHEENPNIRVEVEVVRLESAPSDLIRNQEVGTDPDIAHIFMNVTTALAEQGALLDMTEYFEQWEADNPEQYNNIVDIGWEAGSSDGVPYGMSAHTTAIWHVWRTDWLEEAGVDGIPTTWRETVEAAIQIRDSGILDEGQYPYAISGNASGATNISFNAYFMAMGGQFDESGIPIIDSDAGRSLVTFYQALITEELVNPDALAWGFGEVRGAFVGGNTGMFVMGANVFPAFTDSGLVYGEDGVWMASSQPRRAGAESQHRQFGNAFPYVVSSQTEHPEAVVKVFEYLNRPEIVGEVADRYQPATNRAVSEDPDYQERNPWAGQLLGEWLNMVPAPSHREQVRVNEILVQMVQRAIDETDVNPSVIVADTQAELDEIE